MKVAVVGGGVSGLAAAYILAKDGAEVVVYEKDEIAGGHAKTVTVAGAVLDLGLAVFSQVTYPEITEFFDSLGIGMEVSDTTLSVSLDGGKGCEWGTRKAFSCVFAQRKNILNFSFWKMIGQVIRFKNDALLYVQEHESNPNGIHRIVETLEYFLKSRGYSTLFLDAFLIPSCASVWPCCSPSQFMSFSAYSVLKVLCHQHPFKLIGNSNIVAFTSHSYVQKIKQELESRGCQIKANSQVYSVSTTDYGCLVSCKDGSKELYDRCIIAAHAYDAVEMLGKEATYDELRILNAFQYAQSDIFLHHDINVMPQNQTLWSSRNFLETADDKSCITYWLNNIQNVGDNKLSFFLTVNPPLTPESTLFKWSARHPIPTVAASKASSELNLIQGKRGLWFCGSYQGYGFLEDGVKAGILAANSLLGKGYGSMHTQLKRIVPSWPEAVARLLVMRFFTQFISTGCLILMEEGGSTFIFSGTRRKSTLKATLRIHNLQFYWKIATEADLGLADAYINGDFSVVDKNEGLLNCFMIFGANAELYNQTSKSYKKGWWSPKPFTSIFTSGTKYLLKRIARQNTLSGARKNISHHYDLSNELFSLFLDETMTYSCAMFQNPHEDLKSAQLRKLRTLIEKARISEDHHVLDIGCGWGSLAFEAVKLTGCKYTGITLSEKQFKYANEKVKEASLQDRIEILLCDYRNLPKGCTYDRILSCGMIEHVGHECMDEFFRCCEAALAPNGILVLQFITVAEDKYDEYRHSVGFIKEYIFHGGCLPSLNHITSAMASGSRLSVVHLEEIGCHYFYTLRKWREKFLQNESDVLALGFDEKFIRTWEYYLDYFASGFKLCVVGDYQIVLTRPGDVAAFGGDPYNPVPYAY